MVTLEDFQPNDELRNLYQILTPEGQARFIRILLDQFLQCPHCGELLTGTLEMSPRRNTQGIPENVHRRMLFRHASCSCPDGCSLEMITDFREAYRPPAPKWENYDGKYFLPGTGARKYTEDAAKWRLANPLRLNLLF